MLKHSCNSNLTLIESSTYKSLPLITPTTNTKYYQFIKEYLDSNIKVMDQALLNHSRTLAIRFDLHFPSHYFDPDYPAGYSKKEITRFIESFKSKTIYLMRKRVRNGRRIHKNKLSYIWALESGKEGAIHYHVVLFLNNDNFRSLGIKKSKVSPLLNMLIEAWQSALNITYEKAWNLIHIPENAEYRLKKVNSSQYGGEYRKLYKRLSYLSKADTKVFGQRKNSYGHSWIRRLND